MAILNNNPLVGASGNQGGYNINNSLRFRQSASAYLNRTPSSGGNLKTWTASFWYKNGAIDSNQTLFSNATASDSIGFRSSRTIEIYFGAGSANLVTTQVFRDVAAWYHIVVAVDTTQATAANRIKLYINGSQVTAFSTATYPSQNYDTSFNKVSTAQEIGRRSSNSDLFLDGYMAEVNWIDGSAKTPSDFGETDTTTGVWKPKAYSGTYGTNGFYLKFSDIATTSGSNAGLGKDFSGNGNYWTTNNISVTSGTTYDAMTDVPTNTSATVANYPTLNPLSNTSTLTEANLSASNIELVGTTMATPSTGKWYFEYTQTTSIPSGSLWVGVSSSLNTIPDNQLQGYAYASDGRKIAYNVATSGYGATWTNGDVIGCALDLDNQTITFYKNGTSQGTAFTSITAQPYVFALSRGGVASTKGGSINCGQRPFAYTPPTGFVALNTYNLPTPTILQGNKYMDATLWTGDNANPKAITNAAGFKPDLVWVKSRSNAQQHVLNDSVRGAGTSKGLSSNTTDAEGSANILLYGAVTAFNSNGFSVGDGTSNQAFVNYSPYTYVGWQWQAGQGSTSSNTSGSITSTVSVNTTAGFSVVTFTQPASGSFTVGHGLGVAPKMIIGKDRTSASTNWVVYHSALSSPQSNYLTLNTTNAVTSSTNIWNNTAPTSTVISSISGYIANSNSNTVLYCWAEIAGFSKFGSYTGNANSDGPFVYCGFRPKYIMLKNASAAYNWVVWDTVRSTYNVMGNYLVPNLSDAEASINAIDILSNGFKIRDPNAFDNGSGNTIIYAAFAENPFRYSLAR